MTAGYGELVIICNGKAGKGAVKRHLPQVRALLEQRELPYVVRETQGPGHATELARDALLAGTQVVVAMGGDGTINEVVNGMIENDRPIHENATLGVIAAGTGSDFIKTFGIPGTASHAVAHLDGPERFKIDIGKITFGTSAVGRTPEQTAGGLGRTPEQTVRYFANIAEVGIGAAVVARAQRLPRWLGPTVYFFAFWMTIRKHRMADVVIDLVDRKYEGKMNNLVVANGQFFGGGMKIAPKAAPTDGVLDVQIEHARKREAIALMPKVYKGEHVPHPDIFEAKRVRLSIESETDLLIEADGEVLGTTPASFDLLKEAIYLKV
jgi:YegS/Rv2252/BmrU family lipid kinase